MDKTIIAQNRAKTLELLRSGKYEKATGQFWKGPKGAPTACCTIGGIALATKAVHLGHAEGYTVFSQSLASVGLPYNDEESGVADKIIQKNDQTNLTLPQLADFLETEIFPQFPL